MVIALSRGRGSGMPRKLLIATSGLVSLHVAAILWAGPSANGSLFSNGIEVAISALAAALCFGAPRRGTQPPLLASDRLRVGHVGRREPRLDVLRGGVRDRTAGRLRRAVRFRRAQDLFCHGAFSGWREGCFAARPRVGSGFRAVGDCFF